MIDYETESVDFSILKDKILLSIESQNNGEELIFTTTDGEIYRQIYHEDCCATCSVEEIHGNLNDLIGSKILMAEEVSSNEPSPDLKSLRHKRDALGQEHFFNDSETWTFYKASTIKGSVTIRWYGSSNGYYSESPTFERVKVVE